MDKMGEQEKALKFFRDAYLKAEKGLSKFDIEAMYIVYESTSGPLCLFYLNNEMLHEAIELCAIRINHLKSIAHLTHVIRLCTTLLSLAHQTMIAFHGYLDTKEGQHLLNENPDLSTLIMEQIFSFMFVVSKELEAIEPDSAYLDIVLPHLNRFRKDGFEFVEDMSVKHLSDIMDFLAHNLEKLC